jgi:hypothetical protein
MPEDLSSYPDDAFDPIIASPVSTASALARQVEHWMTDFRSFAEDLLVVQTPEGELLPFKFNNVQIALDEIITDIRANGRLVRLIVDKLRRAGCSTYFDARGYWCTSTRPNTYGLLIAHEPEATDTIFSMTKRFHAHVPKKVRPQVLYDNRKALVFNTKSRTKGLDSELKCGTAGKENFGSSQLVNFAHWSEFSKWPTHTIDDLLTSLMPTIPKTRESEIFIESTANGVGNKYHSMWLQARYHYEMYLDDHGELAWRCSTNETGYNDTNTWSRVFVPWFVFEKCSMPVAAWERQTGLPFELDEEEQKLCDLYLHGCPPSVQKQKIAWYRQVLVDDFHGDKARRAQEYPTTWQESFMSSGDVAFDPYYTQECLELAWAAERKAPCLKYDVDAMTGQFFAHPKGKLWVWEERKEGDAYVVVADIAEGIVINDRVGGDQRHDFTEVSVKHQLTGREVAHWHGKIDPDLLGYLMVWLGKRYNNAWLIPENKGPGNTTISAINRLKYPKIFVERVYEPPNPPRKRYGFSTVGGRDGGVRQELINALAASMRDKRHGIRFPLTFEQMLAFKRNAKGKYEAEHNQHDHCVLMEGIAKYAIPMLPLPANVRVIRGVPEMPMEIPVGAGANRTGGGWE